MRGFASRAIHGQPPFKRDVHGALRFPVYDSAAFEVGSSRELELAFTGRKPSHSYTRITNPTVEEFEQKVRLLTGSFAVVAVASGMAAITETVLALCESGSNIVTSPYLFGNTTSLFESTLKRWGLEVRKASMADPSSLEGVIDDKTRMVFLEIISNPQMEVADISEICRVAKQKNVPVVLDGTLSTPYIFRSKEAGVAVEIISSTKYMSGGATSTGGLIIDNGTFNWKQHPAVADDALKVGPAAFATRLRREIHRNLGSCLAPHNAWLQSLGLETLALRMEKSCTNALEVATFLESSLQILHVNYSGLTSSPFHATALAQFGKRFGGLLTFELSSKEECFNLMDSLKMIKRATNLNDNKTLILHPASTIFCDYNAKEREEMLVNDRMIRLSVGIEDVQDIIDDLKQGLEKL
ncbi:aminotransferase class I/II-fold pyridoxal phosphate-dependent enzyme [Chitinispirillales bacterium ANBcel5]|uniref:aminotransferase class I/II-fold pyridoxal phosphate-dependent enzyme n=1 Tax=Cellulosispirillum alkaliphilum TaxID=3039283 RepID=UPI002A4EBD61|nr:aminotransferase class I/II-fold pyridoxal phosphate-dependent enzyme [Chitinispirillales bacterium ANBcel5]